MIVIVGESASGKSTLQKMFISANPEYKKIVTYTTRPMRDGEQNGVDYHFVSNEEFNRLVSNGDFVEHATYRDWSYGTAKKDCTPDAVAVLTPAGLRALRKCGIETFAIYLKTDRRSRLINILKRGDNIEEAYRRNLTDVGQFDEVDKEVDYVIDNDSFHMNQAETLQCMEAIVRDIKLKQKNENGAIAYENY